MISNFGKSTRNVSCLYSEGKAIEPNNLKLVPKYAHAPSNLKNRLAGSGGECRTGQGRSPTQVTISAGGHWQGEHCAMGEHCPRSRGLPGERRKPNTWRILNGQWGSQKNHSAKPSLIFIRQVINVYTLDLNSRRPVMIFIHGGGFFAGQSINKSTNIPDHRQSKTVWYCQAGRDKLLALLATLIFHFLAQSA